MNSHQGILDAVRSDGRRIRWSDAFTRTNAGPGVWHNAYLVWAPGMPIGYSGGYRASSIRWQHFADGGIDSRIGYGFSGGSYEQVAGFAAMRFLCHVHDIDPPTRRLKGESFIPDPGIVARVVYAHAMRIPSDGTDPVEPEAFRATLAEAHGRWMSPESTNRHYLALGLDEGS